MNRIEIIEGMTKIASDTVCQYSCKECGCKCEYYDAAMRLYDEGYRKLEEGGVLLTPQEYSDYLQLQENYRFAQENIDRLQMLLGKLQDKYLRFFKERDKIRKETAEEIFGELIEAIPNGESDIEISKKTIKYMASLYKAEVSDE